MRITPGVALCVLYAGCTGAYADGRLAPDRVPRISEAETDLPSGPAQPGPRPAPSATAFGPVADERVTEAEVLAHVGRLGREHGRAGLGAVEPGETLAGRLIYCTARIRLGRAPDVLAELERLAAAHAKCPLVWRQLGSAKYGTGDIEGCEHDLREAYRLAKAEGFATCPSLPSYFGTLLLERPETRSEGDALLREELARGRDFVRAASILATDLAGQERHRDALVCLEAAARRAPDNRSLAMGRARILLGLYRPEAAKKVLEPFVSEEPADYRVLERMLRACVLGGEFGPALGFVERLLKDPRLSPEEREHFVTRRKELVKAKELGHQEHAQRWEVYAILRGHPNIGYRRAVLRGVVEHEDAPVREHALRLAFNSEEPTLRAQALILLLPRAKRPLENLRAGLADGSGNVRGTAAALAGRLAVDQDRAAALLLESIAKEDDSYAFRQMHAALRKLTGVEIDLPYGAADDPEGRRAIVAAWRRGK